MTDDPEGPTANQAMTDAQKAAAVDRWLADVSEVAARWRTAKAAQESCERVLAYLVEIRSHVREVPPDLDARMRSAIEANRRNALACAERADALAALESGFYAVLGQVDPPEVAEAWRMRCIEGRTWAQCSMALHYNRQHLERLSKRAKAAAYGAVPEEYRDVR